ncbi:MAG: glycoside hydrolase family 130 protein [Alkalispirochaetaceae bacterium]
MKRESLRRVGTILRPDPGRVLIRRHGFRTRERQNRIVARLAGLSESEARRTADTVRRRFGARHRGFDRWLSDMFATVSESLPTDHPMSEAHRIIIGAAFTQEYALEAAALFNPSMVPHPNQSELPEGTTRFVLSLRATGEGHISSLVFREGEVGPNGEVTVYPASPYVYEGRREENPLFDAALFQEKLVEVGAWNEVSERLLSSFVGRFSQQELENALSEVERRERILSRETRRTIERVRSLLYSHYKLSFPEFGDLSERAIYPVGPLERAGIEDARFVRFVEEDDTVTYYAVYTAFDGTVILPQLLQTDDFVRFSVSTLHGEEVENKGMALFPRRIGGSYVMVGRQDNENLYLMYSDSLLFWREKRLLLRPTFPWECVQIGNSGAPLETEAGWLLFTHGVGPMRTYSIGAVLLDLDDPSRVIGRLPEPLLFPTASEREGYVPNVVYSCGPMVHQEKVILPYAASDYVTRFAVMDLDELLEELLRRGRDGGPLGAAEVAVRDRANGTEGG